MMYRLIDRVVNSLLDRVSHRRINMTSVARFDLINNSIKVIHPPSVRVFYRRVRREIIDSGLQICLLEELRIGRCNSLAISLGSHAW